MRFRTQHRHVIDFIFPIAVFFVFAASSLAVLMLSANVYSTTTTQSNDNYTARTSLAYVNEKIRQNDENGGISVETLEGIECLALAGSYEGAEYTTYIYEYDGMLKELFVRNDVDVSLKDGKNIMPVYSFKIEKVGKTLYRFTSVDQNNNETTLTASGRSER